MILCIEMVSSRIQNSTVSDMTGLNHIRLNRLIQNFKKKDIAVFRRYNRETSR
jgi:hypothetical protein